MTDLHGGWRDASYLSGGGVPVTAWASADGRHVIEKHPFAGKYLLKSGGGFGGIFLTLDAAQRHAAKAGRAVPSPEEVAAANELTALTEELGLYDEG